MPEYIEREALYQKIHESGGCDAEKGSWADGWDSGINEAIRLLEEQPTADVVEVVRCRDCEYLKEGFYDFWCQINSKPFDKFSISNKNHFCSYGKRKEVANSG
jgi:hypothetical protein